ncbi:MAG TPA: hypothetical protein VGL81_34080 [Polyangiaceae bacterium]
MAHDDPRALAAKKTPPKGPAMAIPVVAFAVAFDQPPPVANRAPSR